MMSLKYRTIRKTWGLVYLLWFITVGVQAQVTFKVEQVPADTPEDASIFISGNFEGWSGGSDAYKLSRESDGLYYFTLGQRSGTIQYKFTRGSWASVEKGPSGEEIANRIYTFGGNGDTITVQIESWADGSSGSYASVNVHILDEAFAMAPYFDRSRTIRIYLPTDYETTDKSYPVLYMLDGQNIFDQLTSFSGEWEVDETLDRLHESLGFDLIVVGIDNGGSNRIGEYTPWSNPTYGGGDGKRFAQFMVESLHPYVEDNYRIKSGKDNTGIMGSSLGGLLAHYAGLEYSDVFGKVGVFSPSFWFSDSCYVLASQEAHIEDSFMFFMAGSNESESMVPRMDSMMSLMASMGFPQDHMERVVVPGGQHNEALWRDQFESAVMWLFKDILLAAPEKDKYMESGYTLYPNPTNGIFHVETFMTSEDTLRIQIFQLDGEEIWNKAVSPAQNISIEELPTGLYLVKITGKEYTQTSRLIKY